MTDNSKVWLEFIKVSNQIFRQIVASSTLELDKDHVKNDLKEFTELTEMLDKAKNLVTEMVSDDKKVLDKND